MLKSLSISNYALITELHIQFDSSFTVITGETGAGKSIIIGALSLILGQRADTKSIKNDAEKCIIEAEFNIVNYIHLTDFFVKNELDNDGINCIIRREITNTGKSRAFINDTPVSLNLIRDLSTRLIDIHSQHENLLLSNENYQLDIVDSIAKNTDVLKNYQNSFNEWRSLQAELSRLKSNAAKYASEFDYIQYQFNQLNDAKLIDNEQIDLEIEQQTLSHVEEIKLELQRAQLILENDEHAVLIKLKEIYTGISKIKSFLPSDNNWFERLHEVYIELKDINNEMVSYNEHIDYKPDRLNWIDNRLNELYTLQKKYKVNSIAELISIKTDFEKKLQKIETFDEEIIELIKKINDSSLKLVSHSKLLTNSRLEACYPIESFLIEQLIKLGMPNIQLKVQVTEMDDYTENGKDLVQFLFSANKNYALMPVQLIASGGEISRLMLSIKSLIANKSDLPTIVFDEIDTGVSGEIANRMGEIMQTMSTGLQVITITHLPQIAAKGLQHFRVYKDDSGNETQTFIKELKKNERVLELAQMLSGKNISDAALTNASELLNSN